jgi:isoleucyl-tRNA synthetase
MDRVRQICSSALAVRDAERLRIRLPLRRLTVAGPDLERLDGYRELIADELNVKEVVLSEDVEHFGRFVLRPIGAVVGPALGGATQQVMAAARSGDWSLNEDGSVAVAGHTLTAAQFEFGLQAADIDGATRPLPGARSLVHLDTEVGDELRAEGQARDLIRLVQEARKQQDLVVTDRIELRLAAPEPVGSAVRAHETAVADQVLATSVVYVEDATALAHNGAIDGVEVAFDVTVRN